MSVEQFAEEANRRGLRYVFMRWFEQLPQVDGDLDLLVHDDDMSKLESMFVRNPASKISADIFTVNGIKGGQYLKMPYYPPHLAAEMMDSRSLYKGIFPVPGPREHYFSFAYHAAYHKERKSGLPFDASSPPNPYKPKHSYADKLQLLGGPLGFSPELTVSGLHAFLSEHGWAPSLDLLRRLSVKRPWLRSFYPEPTNVSSGGHFNVFVVRGWGVELGWLDRILDFLKVQGFDVLGVKMLSEREQMAASRKLRGGNWESYTDVPLGKNGPRALIAVFDRHALPVPLHMREAHPFLRNYRFVHAKWGLRDLMQDDLADKNVANSIHSSDDENEAWSYVAALWSEEEQKFRDAIASSEAEGG